ncbi:MAG: hypothetical protein JSS20_09400 [Proteobacteria bacterium]|nr:hypothetical protein [Pseudomonadota bacterium]
MAATAVKLVDLIGRKSGGESRAEALPVDNRHEDYRYQLRVKGASRTNGSSERPDAEKPLDASDLLARDIEALAVQLFAIARQRRGGARQILRETLLSIDCCLADISKKR